MTFDGLLELAPNEFAAIFKVGLLGGMLFRIVFVNAEIDPLHSLVSKRRLQLQQVFHFLHRGEGPGLCEHRHSGDLRTLTAAREARVEGPPTQELSLPPIEDVESQEVARKTIVFDRVPCRTPLSEENVVVALQKFGEGGAVLLQPLLQTSKLGIRVPVDPFASALHSPLEVRIQRDAEVRPIDLFLNKNFLTGAAKCLYALRITELVIFRGGTKIFQMGSARKLQLHLLGLRFGVRMAYEGILKGLVPVCSTAIFRSGEDRILVGETQLGFAFLN
mmetsp:Transcript_46714/g.99936  ORF Transcript_46714/g.99936 Transcript_46714/m.99936 type:complete len:276 (-) Transcript_46714:1050-1877(-)